MKSETRIVLKPALGTTMEEARNARTRAWAFVFECARKRAVVGPAQDDWKESNEPATPKSVPV
jgi:hypothetical protein